MQEAEGRLFGFRQAAPISAHGFEQPKGANDVSLSRLTTGSSLWASQSSTKLLPMKPAPPVMIIMIYITPMVAVQRFNSMFT
jgi:hypothetical protein